MPPEISRRAVLGLGGAAVGAGLLGVGLTSGSETESTVPIFVENRADSEYTVVVIIDLLEELATKTVTVAPGKRSFALRVPEGEFGLTADLANGESGFDSTVPSPEEDFYTETGFFVVVTEANGHERRLWIENANGDWHSN
ncbi:hypothetical protein HBNXHr_0723 [Halorhabdus sp. BNX81]|nr:hypothetical protein HBNXHr_0723 [Halorhabdus sp. BNX81]